MQVPLSADLAAAVDGLRDEVAAERDASVVRQRARRQRDPDDSRRRTDEDAAQKLERDLRVRAHGRLRTLGVWA